jgi:hypothetical protein
MLDTTVRGFPFRQQMAVKATGKLTKTGWIDPRIFARFAGAVSPKPSVILARSPPFAGSPRPKAPALGHDRLRYEPPPHGPGLQEVSLITSALEWTHCYFHRSSSIQGSRSSLGSVARYHGRTCGVNEGQTRSLRMFCRGNVPLALRRFALDLVYFNNVDIYVRLKRVTQTTVYGARLSWAQQEAT